MKEKTKREPDDKEQSARFAETARKLEVDESGKAFELALNTISRSHLTAAPLSAEVIASTSRKKSAVSKK